MLAGLRHDTRCSHSKEGRLDASCLYSKLAECHTYPDGVEVYPGSNNIAPPPSALDGQESCVENSTALMLDPALHSAMEEKMATEGGETFVFGCGRAANGNDLCLEVTPRCHCCLILCLIELTGQDPTIYAKRKEMLGINGGSYYVDIARATAAHCPLACSLSPLLSFTRDGCKPHPQRQMCAALITRLLPYVDGIQSKYSTPWKRLPHEHSHQLPC